MATFTKKQIKKRFKEVAAFFAAQKDLSKLDKKYITEEGVLLKYVDQNGNASIVVRHIDSNIVFKIEVHSTSSFWSVLIEYNLSTEFVSSTIYGEEGAEEFPEIKELLDNEMTLLRKGIV